MLLDGAVARAGLAAAAARRPVLAGLVTQPPVHDTGHAVRWLLLAGPRGDGTAYVHAYRTSGRPVFAGTLAGERLTLGTADAPGNVVVDVAGRVRGADVVLDRRLSTGRVTRTRNAGEADLALR